MFTFDEILDGARAEAVRTVLCNYDSDKERKAYKRLESKAAKDALAAAHVRIRQHLQNVAMDEFVLVVRRELRRAR